MPDEQPKNTEIKKEETSKKEEPPKQGLSADSSGEAERESNSAKPEAPKAEKKVLPKIEKQANCPVCNKSIKKKWYYRNLAYYCSKGCFRQAKKKAEEEKKKSEEGKTKENEKTSAPPAKE